MCGGRCILFACDTLVDFAFWGLGICRKQAGKVCPQLFERRLNYKMGGRDLPLRCTFFGRRRKSEFMSRSLADVTTRSVLPLFLTIGSQVHRRKFRLAGSPDQVHRAAVRLQWFYFCIMLKLCNSAEQICFTFQDFFEIAKYVLKKRKLKIKTLSDSPVSAHCQTTKIQQF